MESVAKMSRHEVDTMELEAGGQLDSDDAHLSPTTHSNSGVYETRYQKSLRHYLTREALPKESHYRNLDSIVDGSARPTLDDLHQNTFREREVSVTVSDGELVSDDVKDISQLLCEEVLSISESLLCC